MAKKKRKKSKTDENHSKPIGNARKTPEIYRKFHLRTFSCIFPVFSVCFSHDKHKKVYCLIFSPKKE